MARFLFLLCGVLSTLALGAKQKREQEWPHSSFKTGAWQPPHLSLRKVGDNIDPGKIFLSVRNGNETDGTAPTIYDNNGDMVWQGPHEKTMDFKMQKLFGQDVITYWDGETGVLGYGYGKVHILDNTYKQIHTVTLQDDFITPTGEPRDSYVDVHEHYITPRNTMIVSAINVTQTDLSAIRGGRKDMWVIDPLFYEIDIATNKVLFKWDALEHKAKIPITKSKERLWGGWSQAQPWDGFHMNSVTPTNDGYLVDMRFLWSAYYLNKDGSVRWELSGANNGDGDFTTRDVHFSWQHDARVYNETDKGLVLTLFNNAANRQTQHTHTTGMAIHLDLVNMTASPIYNIADPIDQVVSRTQGSFQFLNYEQTGHIFMGYGSVCKVKEYDAEGNIVLSGQFGGLGHAQSYRAFKFDWHATPFWPPRLVVKHSTTYYTTDVYMSWNGATDYDNWVILAVPARNATMAQGTVLATHDRTGFETHVAFEDVYAPYIMAVARQGDRLLRASPIVPFSA